MRGGLGYKQGREPKEVKYDFTLDTGERDLAGVINVENNNNAGFCLFISFGMPPKTNIRYINAITGFAYTEDDFNRLGIRSFAIRHAFNMREGLPPPGF